MNSRTSPQELLNSTACKCSKGCTNDCGCKKKGKKCSPICFKCRGASGSNVPENIKNRSNLDDVLFLMTKLLKNFWMKMPTTTLNKNNFCSAPNQKCNKLLDSFLPKNC
ncbi:hypothetical protein AVEN_182674-1 [Araneus ventricosus]|uniref:Tesmin/TSO1-like CXC domain-containing protein n=1 Tax=Araneus ventricosus TaxID=182803 RepID=A0A4Y2L7Q2_ARAVE|nr:hypothetical protein AVEN_182674-1 [Araneus ventricosus]